MPRACTVCTSANAEAIDKAVIDGQSLRVIAKQFAVSFSAVQRHKHDHLGPMLARRATGPTDSEQRAPAGVSKRHAAAIQKHADRVDVEQTLHALDLEADLRLALHRARKLSDACDAWLTDADDPSRYDIGPRGTEILVTVEDWQGIEPNEKPRRKKASLQQLLADIEANGRYVIQRSEVRFADPRKLVLDTSESVKSQYALLLSALDQLYSAQEVKRFQVAVLNAVDEVAPDVRVKIDESLRRHRPVRRVLPTSIG